MSEEILKEKSHKYYEENKEKIKEGIRKYHEENKEKIQGYHQKYYEKNNEKIKEGIRKYREENKEKIKEYNRKYHEENKENNRKYREENKEKIQGYHQKYHEENREMLNERSRKYHQENREISNQRARKYWENKRINDLKYRLTINGHHRIKRFLKSISNKEALELLGCNIEEYKEYLINKLPERYVIDDISTQKLHIDHIKPISSFDLTNPEQQKECFNFKNTQLLSALENLRKANKIIN